jgi:hypothetical protein
MALLVVSKKESVGIGQLFLDLRLDKVRHWV